MPLLLPFLECKGVSKDLKDNGYKNTLQKSAIVQMDGACVTPATGPVLNREVALECCGLEYATEEGVVGAPRHKPSPPHTMGFVCGWPWLLWIPNPEKRPRQRLSLYRVNEERGYILVLSRV